MTTFVNNSLMSNFYPINKYIFLSICFYVAAFMLTIQRLFEMQLATCNASCKFLLIHVFGKVVCARMCHPRDANQKDDIWNGGMTNCYSDVLLNVCKNMAWF